MSINLVDLVNSSGSPFSGATTGSIAQQEGATPNTTGGVNAPHSTQPALYEYRGPFKEIPPPIAVSKPPQAAATAQTFDYYSNQGYSNPSQTVTAVPRTQKSYADLTTIPLDVDTKTRIQNLDDLTKGTLRNKFFERNRWDRLISLGANGALSMTVQEAVRILQISGKKDIINLTGKFPISTVPITDKLSEIEKLKAHLKNKRIIKKELGEIYQTIIRSTPGEEKLKLDVAKKLDGIYKKHMKKNLFDFNSVRSKAIQVANEQIEKERTHSQFSSTSKKRSNHELTSSESDSSESDQPKKKKPRVRQDDRQQHLAVEANPFNHQQQFHVPHEGYNYSQLEPIGTGSLQQQNDQPQHNNAFPPQQAQYTPVIPHEQYCNYQMTQNTAVLIQQQNSQYQQNNFPFQLNNSSQPEQIGTGSIQQWNNQPEQNDIVILQPEEYLQFFE